MSLHPVAGSPHSSGGTSPLSLERDVLLHRRDLPAGSALLQETHDWLDDLSIRHGFLSPRMLGLLAD